MKLTRRLIFPSCLIVLREIISYLSVFMFGALGLHSCSTPNSSIDGEIMGVHGEGIKSSQPSDSQPQDSGNMSTGFFGMSRTPDQADPERNREVRESMQRVQWCAEHYASDHGTDKYPQKMDDEFKSYFPGGREGATPAPVGSVNVFTGVNEFPSIGTISSVRSTRFGQRFQMRPGQIQYCPMNHGKGYAIIGGAGDGLVLLDENNPGQILVFSNFDE